MDTVSAIVFIVIGTGAGAGLVYILHLREQLGKALQPVPAAPVAVEAQPAIAAPVDRPINIFTSDAVAVVDSLRCATCSVCKKIVHAYETVVSDVDQTVSVVCHDCSGKGKK